MELQHFDICSGGLLPDVMHDILEGALPYEAKLILQHCIDEDYFSFNTLSHTLRSMELGYMEITNRPSHFTNDILQSASKALGQNGEFWLLLSVSYDCIIRSLSHWIDVAMS